MPALTYTTAIVVIPPPDIWPPIQAIRKEHDRKVRRWMPHVTLVYPFRLREDFAALREPLAIALSRLSPFGVDLAEFRAFRHRRGNYTIWLKPEPQEPWIDLHRVVRAASLGQEGPVATGRFQPHLSVGQVQGKGQMERLVEQLQSAWTALVFRVDQVSLIWRGERPDDVFRIAETIPFGSDSK